MDRNMQGAPRMNVTPEMMKNFKTVTCECGGMVMETGIVLKKISAILSPTGKEELYPLEVLICKKCGKVPSELNTDNILPDEIVAKKNLIKTK